ncbi:hypothetical protein [Streptomyces acidiscabies]|uniref:Uncharacterized protein n=1 Tax=Streptomyces acidiscabies TaxID=42234 RepID=A0A0L0JZ51_9ACTN|nr:hypothetical protein [Streptomyces acidiscabies]KND30843.1 hypothetical protein IQ63_27450 [Streptomyces acidiscabies]
MKTAVKRAGIVAIGFASSPAMASNVGISLPNGRGTMTFIDDGDKFRVCDTRVDDHGVTILTIDDGGDNGCDTKETDLIGTTPHDMILCWNGGGACVVSPVIRES